MCFFGGGKDKTQTSTRTSRFYYPKASKAPKDTSTAKTQTQTRGRQSTRFVTGSGGQKTR